MKLIRYQYPTTKKSTTLSQLFDSGAPSTVRFGKLFDEFLGVESSVDQLPVDLYEDDNNFYARMELPGVDKDKIDLELENSILKFSCNYSEKTKGRKANYSFNRSISVPDEAAQDQVSANYKDGILTVTLPKQEVAEARRIKVK